MYNNCGVLAPQLANTPAILLDPGLYFFRNGQAYRSRDIAGLVRA